MSRAYHKSWQSDRPMKKETKRVRWFQGRGLQIRLCFEDQFGRTNRFYPEDGVEATKAYEAFIAGEFGALQTPLEST